MIGLWIALWLSTYPCTLDDGRCSCCKVVGLRSRVEVGMCQTTAMAWTPYYNDDGRLHDHDPNITECEWRCCNGHRGLLLDRKTPCWCGWSP